MEGGESKGEESGGDDFLLAVVSGSALCLFCFALVCVRNPEGGELSWRLGKVVPQRALRGKGPGVVWKPSRHSDKELGENMVNP